MPRRIALLLMACLSVASTGFDLPDDPLALKGLPPAIQDLVAQLKRFGDSTPELKPLMEKTIRELESTAIKVGDSYATRTKEVIDFAFARVEQKVKLLALVNDVSSLMKKNDKEGVVAKLKQFGSVVNDAVAALPPPKLDTPTPGEYSMTYMDEDDTPGKVGSPTTIDFTGSDLAQLGGRYRAEVEDIGGYWRDVSQHLTLESDYKFSLNVSDNGIRFEPGDKRIRLTHSGVPFPRTIPITWRSKQPTIPRTFEPTKNGLSGGASATFANGISFETQQKLPPRAKVSAIVIKYTRGDVIRGIQIIADLDGRTQPLDMHGGKEGDEERINLDADEYFVGIEGRTGVNVDSIQIRTTKRTIGPYGKNAGGDECYHFYRKGYEPNLAAWPHLSDKPSEKCHRQELPVEGEIVGFYGKVHAERVITQIGVISRSVGHTQIGWYWCDKCGGMFHQETPLSSRGICMADKNGDPHTIGGAAGYRLICHGPWPGTQPEFKECDRCRALFQFTNPVTSHCPAGGPHVGTSSRVFSLYHDSAEPFGQDGWRWCGSCGSIFHSGAAGVCPVGGQGHSKNYSFDYRMMLR